MALVSSSVARSLRRLSSSSSASVSVPAQAARLHDPLPHPHHPPAHPASSTPIGIALASVLALALPAGADVTRLVIFGDSLSDTGNALSATTLPFGIITPRPDRPWYSQGRWTNGADNTGAAFNSTTNVAQSAFTGVWHERLASRLGVTAAGNSLAGGRNYAFGGADTTSTTFGVPPLVTFRNSGSQLDQYAANRLTNVESTLFTFWTGANDLRNAASAGGATPASVLAAADTAVANLRAQINRLATDVHPNSTINVLWPNVPPLNLTPDASVLPANLRAALGDASSRFRTLQATAASDLMAANPRVRIFTLDIFTLFNDLVAGRGDWVPANTTTGIINAPSFVAPTFSPTRQPTSLVPAGANPDTYLFWDQLHPTARGHRSIGDAAFNVIPSPSVVGVLMLAGVVAGRRRRG